MKKIGKRLFLMLLVVMMGIMPVISTTVEVNASTKSALKDIKKKLRKNNFRFETTRYTDDNDPITVSIIYKKISDVLSFKFEATVSDGDDYYTYTAKIDGNKKMKGKTTAEVTVSNGILSWTGTTDIIIEKTSATPSYDFDITNNLSTDQNNDDFQDTFNSILETGLSCWDSYLKETTGYNLKDIGFKKCKH